MSRISEYEPVVGVIWSGSGSRGWIEPNGDEKIEALGPGWMVGFLDINTLPPELVCEIDGLRFAFDTSQREYPKLAGAALEYTNEGFVIVQRAD